MKRQEGCSCRGQGTSRKRPICPGSGTGTKGSLLIDTEWSTPLVGYPKWKVDVDSGRFPSVKIARFVSSRTQTDTLGGKVNNGVVLNLRLLNSPGPAHNK